MKEKMIQCTDSGPRQKEENYFKLKLENLKGLSISL